MVRVGLDCLWGMERTVQMLAVHCVLKQNSGILASPGTMRGHLPTQQTRNRSSTSSRLFHQRLLQHSAMHTTAASLRQQDTHTRMRTRTHIQTQTRACIHTGTHAHIHMQAHKRRHTREHTYTRTNIQAHTRAHTHTHTRTHTHTHTRTRTRSHAYAPTCCARDGLRQFFSVASDAPTLVVRYMHFYTVGRSL